MVSGFSDRQFGHNEAAQRQDGTRHLIAGIHGQKIRQRWPGHIFYPKCDEGQLAEILQTLRLNKPSYLRWCIGHERQATKYSARAYK